MIDITSLSEDVKIIVISNVKSEKKNVETSESEEEIVRWSDKDEPFCGQIARLFGKSRSAISTIPIKESKRRGNISTGLIRSYVEICMSPLIHP